MIGKDTAVSLKHGTTLYHTELKNKDGTALRCRVNGKAKTWRRRPFDFQLPVKYGLRTCFYITNFNGADKWTCCRYWRTKEQP